MQNVVSSPNVSSVKVQSFNDFTKQAGTVTKQTETVAKPATTSSAPIKVRIENLDKLVLASNKNKESKKNGLVALLVSIGIVVAELVLFYKFLSKIFKNMIEQATKPRNPLVIFEPLKNAAGIEDMALPEKLKIELEKLRKVFNNMDTLKQKGAKNSGKTILLYGPPGTGKTTFAKAIAKEFPNSRFASLDITPLNSKYIGQTEKNLHYAGSQICEYARTHANEKIFVFIDEIDSVMMVDVGNGAKHSNDILNEFKKCFTEQLGKLDNIITIGATNLPIDVEKGTVAGFGKHLDKAMLDRFQEKIYVGLPCKEQLLEAFTKHFNKLNLVEDSLKNPDKRLEKLCEFLANEKHEVSFRTLDGILEESAVIGNPKEKLSFEDILKVIKNKAVELHISNEELENFIASLDK